MQEFLIFFQGSYTRGIEPNYANKLPVPVPKMTDDGKRSRVKNHKWKLRAKVGFSGLMGQRMVRAIVPLEDTVLKSLAKTSYLSAAEPCLFSFPVFLYVAPGTTKT